MQGDKILQAINNLTAQLAALDLKVDSVVTDVRRLNNRQASIETKLDSIEATVNTFAPRLDATYHNLLAIMQNGRLTKSEHRGSSCAA